MYVTNISVAIMEITTSNVRSVMDDFDRIDRQVMKVIRTYT